MKILLIISLIGLAFVMGLVAPDIDQRFSFLTHRSIITHGPWLALLATWAASQFRHSSAMPLIACGFALGLTIHFASDLFPKQWIGYALIHVPFWRRLAPLASIVWLAVSLIVSLACALAMGWRAVPKEQG